MKTNLLKEHKLALIISSIVLLLPILLGLFLWEQLPDTIATHFNSEGVADGYSSKAFAVLGLPCILLLVHWVCIFITSADPKKQNIAGKPFALILWIAPLVSILGSFAIYKEALNIAPNLNSSTIATLFLGFLFIVIGNYLPKCKQNYTIGIKIPWALHDEENWNHTHRFAGIVWMIGGIVLIVTALFNQLAISLIILIIMAILPMIYSYLYYKKHTS